MLAYCTYCSAEKNLSEFPISAIDLYKSKRILEVFSNAETNNIRFIILSGKYGIISANEKIAYYDHLLIASEVESHADIIANQLKKLGISEIIFFSNFLEKDKNLKPYHDCIKLACLRSSIPLSIKVADFQD